MMGYDSLDDITPLFADLSICAEILHCTHEEFENLSRIEKNKLRLYVATKNAKQDREMEKKRREQVKEEELMNNAPDTQRLDRSKRYG